MKGLRVFVFVLLSLPLLSQERIESLVLNGVQYCPCPPGTPPVVRQSATAATRPSSTVRRTTAAGEPINVDVTVNVPEQRPAQQVQPLVIREQSATQGSSAIDDLIKLEILEMRRERESRATASAQAAAQPSALPVLPDYTSLLQRQNEILESQARSLRRANLLNGINTFFGAGSLTFDYLSYRRLGQIKGELGQVNGNTSFLDAALIGPDGTPIARAPGVPAVQLIQTIYGGSAGATSTANGGDSSSQANGGSSQSNDGSTQANGGSSQANGGQGGSSNQTTRGHGHR